MAYSRSLLLRAFILTLILTWSSGTGAVNILCLKDLYRLKSKPDGKTIKFGLASGNHLPYDSGKYHMCSTSEGSRYFLATMTVNETKFDLDGLPDSLKLELGLCLTPACDSKDIQQLIDAAWDPKNPLKLPAKVKKLTKMGRISVVSVTSPNLDKDEISTRGYVFCGALAFILSIVTLATTIHILSDLNDNVTDDKISLIPSFVTLDEQTQHRSSPTDPPSPPVPRQYSLFVQCFSLKFNIKKLTAPSPESSKETDSLSGMRVMSMFWIILGHTFMMPFPISGYSNPEAIVGPKSAQESPWLQFLIAGHCSVDSFFYLSGFLMAYLGLKEFATKPLDWKLILKQTVFRYIRLTPSLAFMMMIYTSVVYYYGNGPFFSRFQKSVTRRCTGTWWTELTYTEAFFPWDPDMICMGWTWYLGNDFIFSIVGLMIMSVYLKSQSAAWAILTSICSISIVSQIIFGQYRDIGLYLFDSHYTRYSYHTYSRPWFRIPAYLVGVASAWLLVEGRRYKLQFRSKAALRIINLVALLLMILVVVVPYTDFKDPNSWSALACSAYASSGRPVWAICLAIISISIITCGTRPKANGGADSAPTDMMPRVGGYATVPIEEPSHVSEALLDPLFVKINDFLCLYFWTPMARLTYGAYLSHPVIIKWLAATADDYYVFSYADVISRWIANVVYAYLFAMVVYFLMERPMMTLIGITVRKGRGS